MSDFLVDAAPLADPQRLLRLLALPYGDRSRSGSATRRPWGAFAVLDDLIEHGQNRVASDSWTAAWVGDSPNARPLLSRLLQSLQQQPEVDFTPASLLEALRKSGFLKEINGAFALLISSPRAWILLSDPMSSVPVYLASLPQGSRLVAGTHADLVALAAEVADDLDPNSVADFLNTGTPCVPHTLYRHVRELAPGSVLIASHPPGQSPRFLTSPYWSPPSEPASPERPAAIAEEFALSWSDAVRQRSTAGPVAVQLSGGLDSRVVIACVPPSIPCTGLTYLDEMNREAQVARQVAAVYQREWRPLQRDEDYLARTAIEATRFIGCEGEWHHAHAIGFVDEIQKLGFATVLTGLFMDNNFKGYYARDMVRVSRCAGLLTPRYLVQPRDYALQLGPLCRQFLRPEFQESIVSRRAAFAHDHFARHRGSPWEWLDGHPLSQASDNTGWMIERRLLPLRLPVYDRRLVDLAFRIPAVAKGGGELFVQCALRVLGPGRLVPNANDGVLPGSSHARRLLQRLLRKAQNRLRKAASLVGIRTPVPHSWHDYQRYWRENPLLAQLRHSHGHLLDRFDATLLQAPARSLFDQPGLPWRERYRLLQLALWLSHLQDWKRTTLAQPPPASHPTSPAPCPVAS